LCTGWKNIVKFYKMQGTYSKTRKQLYLCSAVEDTPKILVFKNNYVTRGLVLNANGKKTGNAQAKTPF
jgi:hypothetical protein